jgi:hypothetical protein
MSAGPKYEYRWADGVKVKKPIECSAPEYIEYLMEWVESQLDDESVRPDSGARFRLLPPLRTLLPLTRHPLGTAPHAFSLDV